MDESTNEILTNLESNKEFIKSSSTFAKKLSDFIILPDVTYNLTLPIDQEQCKTNITTMKKSNTLNQLHLGFTAFCIHDSFVTFRDLQIENIEMLEQLQLEIYEFIIINVLELQPQLQELQEQISELQIQLQGLQEQILELQIQEQISELQIHSQGLQQQIVTLYKRILEPHKLDVVITHQYSINSPGRLTFNVELKSSHMFNNESDFWIGSNNFSIDELINNIKIPGYTEVNLPIFTQQNLVQQGGSKSEQEVKAELQQECPKAEPEPEPEQVSGTEIDLTKYQISCCYWDKITLRVLWNRIDQNAHPDYYVMEITPAEYISNEFEYLFGTGEPPIYLFGDPNGKQYYYRSGQLKYRCQITEITAKTNLKSFMIQYPDKPIYLKESPSNGDLSIMINLIMFIKTKYNQNQFAFIQKLVIYKLLFTEPTMGRWIEDSENWSLEYKIFTVGDHNWLLLQSKREHKPTEGIYHYITWYIPPFITNTNLWKQLVDNLTSNKTIDTFKISKSKLTTLQSEAISQLESNDLSTYKCNVFEFTSDEINALYVQIQDSFIPELDEYILKFHVFMSPMNLLPHIHITKSNTSLATKTASDERHSRTMFLKFIMENNFDFKQLKINQFMLVSEITDYADINNFFYPLQ